MFQPLHAGLYQASRAMCRPMHTACSHLATGAVDNQQMISRDHCPDGSSNPGGQRLCCNETIGNHHDPKTSGIGRQARSASPRPALSLPNSLRDPLACGSRREF
jgi:hypothetical protein